MADKVTAVRIPSGFILSDLLGDDGPVRLRKMSKDEHAQLRALVNSGILQKKDATALGAALSANPPGAPLPSPSP